MPKKAPYLDPALDQSSRVADLLSRMTIAEKISQMLHESPAIPRLGLAAYSWWNEALHGVARAGSATIFPQAIGLAACFDRKLTHDIATAISDEARAKFGIFSKKQMSGRYLGLTFWTPNINIFRDPRWGRGQETYGEDPYLTGEIGQQFVQGLQGTHPTYLKTAACAKHFAVHSGPEKDRHSFDAIASAYDLEDTYLPAFKKLVQEAQVESVMGAYNRTNGEPCCGSDFLLRQKLRGEWGFKGHVVSDCWALQDFHLHHKVTNTAAESAALALRMGCDLNCGCTFTSLIDALVQGLITEEDINIALSRLLTTRFKLGEFDPPRKVPWSRVKVSVIRSAKHLNLSYQAALQSMVLLKNNGILPLDRNSLQSLYMTGPNGLGPESLLGNYHGLSPRMVSFVEGMTEACGNDIKFEFRHGSLLAETKKMDVDWASFEAKEFQVTMAFMGLNILLEGEEGDAIAGSDYGDRTSIGLPQGQHDFLMKLLDSDKPIILVVSAGSAIDLSPYVERAAAIIYTWYPGELGGKALADLVFGTCDFSGKLPITFPRNLDDLPAFANYDMRGRTYRYLRSEPLFPFGFGLSYRSLLVTEVTADRSSLVANQSLVVYVEVCNHNRQATEDVVQVYLSKSVAGKRSAHFELAGFERVNLRAKAKTVLRFTIHADQIALVHEDGTRNFENGLLKLYAGCCQPDERSQALGGGESTCLELYMQARRQ